MGWEQRGNHRYFYRKEWQGGRCVSTYLGNSETALLIGECERLRQHEVAKQREQERRRRAESEVESRAVADGGKLLRTLVAAILTANEYHQHRGQWRKRMTRERPAYGESSPIPEEMLPAKPDPAEVRRGLEALRAAMNIKPQGTGKKGAVTSADEAQAEKERRRTVRQVLNDYPCIWSHVRIMLTTGKDEMLKMAGCSRDSTAGMILRRSMDSLEAQLGYATAPVLEQMLIEHIVLSWLDLDIVQMKYAKLNSESHTLTSGAYWDRRLNSAQQRYLRAVEALARVRRLSRVTPLQMG